MTLGDFKRLQDEAIEAWAQYRMAWQFRDQPGSTVHARRAMATAAELRFQHATAEWQATAGERT